MALILIIIWNYMKLKFPPILYPIRVPDSCTQFIPIREALDGKNSFENFVSNSMYVALEL